MEMKEQKKIINAAFKTAFGWMGNSDRCESGFKEVKSNLFDDVEDEIHFRFGDDFNEEQALCAVKTILCNRLNLN